MALKHSVRTLFGFWVHILIHRDLWANVNCDHRSVISLEKENMAAYGHHDGWIMINAV